MIFNRNLYLQKLISADGNGMIKIITGIRRCGKSFLLFNIFRNYLLSHGVQEDHIIGLALDDVRNIGLLTPEKLLDYIDNHIVNDDKKTYIILDEVQLVNNFVGVLLSLTHMQNVEAELLGEAVEGVGGEKRDALEEYYTYGGLPAVAMMSSKESKQSYLKDLYRTIYLKDIIERNRLQNEEGLEEIFRVLASSMGTTVNPTKIANTFKSVSNLKISSHTISKYIEHLKDAFMVSEAERYDIKGRKYIGADSKYYFEDPGIRNAILGFRQVEFSHMMENVLYNELCARGYSVDVGLVEVWEKNEQGKMEHKILEVDYVINRGSQRIYIQSAYMMPDQVKAAQEQRPLTKISDSFRKVIISGDNYGKFYNDEGILRIGVFEFLLNVNCLDE